MSFWGTQINLNRVATNPNDSDVSTADTVHQMIALVRSCAYSPQITAIVNTLLRSLPQNPTNRDLVRAIYWFVKRTVKFTEDEDTLYNQLGYKDVHQELLIHPLVLLAMPQPSGDCDDFSMLCATLLVGSQIPCAFVTICADKSEPWRWSHVYVQAYLNDEKRWVTLDCSHGSQLGWEYSKEVFRKAIWKI